MTEKIVAVVGLLAQGKTTEALKQALADLRELEESSRIIAKEISTLEDIIETIGQSGGIESSDADTNLSQAQRSVRRRQVLSMAQALASDSSDYTVTTDQVVEALEAEGVPSRNLKIVVGNLLGKSEDWETIGSALYQFKVVREVPPGQDANPIDDLPF
jgi:multidrug resistance efflux pump